MTRAFLTALVLLSLLFFPWQFTALLVAGLSLYLPLLPLSAGILFDALYYAPSANALVLGAPQSSVFGWPFATLFGAILTACVFIVRNRLNTSPVRDFGHIGE
ncbi:hypothetical protein HYV30_01750 [Candidatus Kaiserbacteria bacterium]|nr:hypothetical protein [Candidatus Kaiserbacteria bacterium]